MDIFFCISYFYFVETLLQFWIILRENNGFISFQMCPIFVIVTSLPQFLVVQNSQVMIKVMFQECTDFKLGSV